MKRTLLSLILTALLNTYALIADPVASAPVIQGEAQPQPLLHSIDGPTTLPEIAATTCIAIDLHSEQTSASNNADASIGSAALTQMMTAYLASKALENGTLEAGQILIVSNAAWKVEGSHMFLGPKVPVSVSSLAKGTTIQLTNDVVIALTEAIGNDSIDEFVRQMNEEIKRLGMKHTHFNNPTDISSNGHVSTVGDLAILAVTLIDDYPEYCPLFTNKSFKYNNIKQPNRNLLLYRDSNIDGLKTGYSEGAGYYLAASSERNNRRIVSILAGAKPTGARASESNKLFNWSLQAFDAPKPYNDGGAIPQVRIYKGSTKAADTSFLDNAYIIIPHDIDKDVKPISETLQPVLAPIERGQVLGKLKVMKDGKIIAERDVVTLNGVEESNWLRRIWDAIVLWLKGLFS